MFASENGEAIQQKMEEIRTENPELDLVGGGCVIRLSKNSGKRPTRNCGNPRLTP
jgi:hypothetical protein